MLSGKHVVLGVTGGIAAYKSCEIVSRLRKLHADVRVVMTQNAREFVTPLTFETLSGNAVYSDAFARAFEIEHIALSKWADVLLIAPATANMIGKLANGIADDLLSTTAMAMPAPLVLAPAMNAVMWRSAANQRNVRTLLERGASMIGPETGRLSCGDEDIGRMSEPETVVEAIVAMLCKKRDLNGYRILVTAGPTRERIDPVRFLSNHSTGKMGYAIAEAAHERGAMVTLVSGPCAIEPPKGVEFVQIESTMDLYDAVTTRAKDCHAVIQAAAPADFRPASASDRKIKKDKAELSLPLVSNPDIAEQLGKAKAPGQVLVGFAAETDELIEHARAKLKRKNVDLIVANDVTQLGAGFGVDTNIVTLIDANAEEMLPMMSKLDVAHRILDRVRGLLK